MSGVVLSLIASRGEVVLRHDPFGGMPGMTMLFSVEPRSAVASLRIGDTISAGVSRNHQPWTISRIQVTAHEPVDEQFKAIRRVPILQEGDRVPQTRFVDQDGRAFSFAQFLGRNVVLAFIYTRCRDPRMCPLISAKFGQLQTAFANTDTHLVEITLDPQYDTPPILKRYAAVFGAHSDRWTLGTGNADRVLDFDARFGIQPFPDPAAGIIHTERTALIDRTGTIRYLIDDPSWSVSGIVAQVNAIDRKADNPIARLDLALSRAAVAICGDRVAGFSGLFDLAVVMVILAAFGYAFYRIGRAILSAR
ncbi:MAG: SCO family protein [Candidatus Eremiobacteraeota bacterium]|nr:SCO family protein [Candidatus Eremiobacteraeota bacterium]